MKYKTSITMRGISMALQLPLVTVQRSLSGHPYVNAETREKVIQFAHQNGYDSRLSWKSIVFIVGTFDFQAYLGYMLYHLEQVFSAARYSLEIIHKKDLSRLHEYLVSGAVSLDFYTGLERHWNSDHFIPMVALNSLSNLSENVIAVNSDEAQGIELMAEQLYNLGHRRIAIIFGSEETTNPTLTNRRLVFEKFCQKHNIWSQCGCYRTGHGITMKQVLNEPLVRKMTGFITAGEGVGRTLIESLRHNGYRIPEDVSVMGLSYFVQNEDAFRISGCSQNYSRLAELTLKTLENQIQGKRPNPVPPVPYLELQGNTIASPR